MRTSKARDDSPQPIAIIGMACIFPQAADLQAFWNNILGCVDAIGEPVDNWGARRYLDSGRIKTQFGGYLKDLYRFDPREFGIMPNSMDGGEPDQLLALRVARDALVDAGYWRPDFDHTDTGVVIGHSTYLHRGQGTIIQNNIVVDQMIEVLQAAVPHLSADAIDRARTLLAKKLPPMNADTAPGLVPSVMTGRIANRLNLRGPNYLVDAACSSSLLAVGAAIDELRAGRSRMMLAGGVNASLPADVTTIFTQLGALSSRGRVRPFDAGSDGTLLGEGLGMVVLKRVGDALADGDRIYAVLRGVGQSSDGKGTGLLAPSQDGETLAMRRAYAASGVAPETISLVEAHGTGIPLGDKTEIASLKSVFGERTTQIGVKALGSVKSMISHCIPAAGVASLIKMALALHHRVLPPTLCDNVNPELGIDTTPFYVNTEAAPWFSAIGRPRRAAINAFGFGGTNAHAIVEQAPAAARRPPRLNAWPAELCVFSAESVEALMAKLVRLAADIAAHPEWRLPEVAAALARSDTEQTHRMAIVARDLAALADTAAKAAARLRTGYAGGTRPRPTRSSVAYGSRRVQGKLAFLFPGEGSQYPAMFADLAACFDEIQGWLDFWHGLYGLPLGQTRTDIVFPTSEIGVEVRKQLEHKMHEMDVGSESVFIGGMAMFELLVALGVEPDVMVGHSTGESAALCAAGANRATDPDQRAACIKQHFEVYEEMLRAGKIPTGALLAVGALPPETVEAHIAASRDVVMAMDNCANQLVLYGSVAGIAEVQKSLTEMGGICMSVPFDRGYHTPAFQDASTAFLGYYRNIRLGRPKVPLYSCASAGLFPSDAAAVRKLAAAQWAQKVRFRETIQNMHEDGVRLFIEVGPSSNLTSFVNDILIDRDFAALATNVRRKNDVERLLSVLGQLYVAGRGPVLERLFGGRAITEIDLSAPPPPIRGVVLDNTMPMVRLSDADRSELRRLSAVEEKSPLGPSVASPLPVDEDASAHAADGRHRVMAEYFHLMQGFLEQQRSLVEAWSAVDGSGASAAPSAPESVPASGDHVSRTPLIDTVVEHDEAHLVARCTVGLKSHNFIRDHVMSAPVTDTDAGLFGLSCVPFAVSLEIMAEACALLAGRVDLRVIENVEAFDWVALDDGELTFEVRADAVDRARGHYTAGVITASGVVLRAEFRFDADWQLPEVPPLVERRVSCLNKPHLYDTGMFHGPVFQSMAYAQAWDDTGIDLELSDVSLKDFLVPGKVPQLILNPVLLDAMGQIVACWFLQYVGTEFHAFPSTIGRIELQETCPTERPGIVARMRQRPVDGVSTDLAAPRAWQFECVDGEGRVLLRGADLVNLFFRVPNAYHRVRTDPLNGFLGHRLPLPIVADTSVALWEVPFLAEDFCAQSGAICLRILAHALLSTAERGEWSSLRGQPRRRREWLFGRAAIKEAVRAWIHEQTGELIYPSDIVVQSDANGAPVVDGWWCDSVIAAPRVSLSHNGSAGLAAVAPADQPVGVDLEHLGRLRDPDLLVQSMAPAERSLIEGLDGPALNERVLRLWCAKEAASKCLGTGLQGQPSAFVVVAADPGCERLVVQHELGDVEVRVQRQADRVIAVAGLELSGVEVPG
jgi:acyl transferase domain-containing protein/4'-phosphopantetheinyl transferase EntD